MTSNYVDLIQFTKNGICARKGVELNSVQQLPEIEVGQCDQIKEFNDIHTIEPAKSNTLESPSAENSSYLFYEGNSTVPTATASCTII